VIDEMLTLDSSRYWPADEWAPGASPSAFDKQIVRDAMDATGWNHEPPPPPVPPQVIAGTRARYIECYELLTGCSFDDWFDVTDA
jgi:phosphoribosylaminoimidazole-succinocarboxamide synthase